MSLLIEWITQIIIFLLVATIIDMLIPSTSTKKYIKLVLGLILLLIFLKPLFYIFQMDIESAVKTSIQKIDDDPSKESTGDLIKKQEKEIQASQDAYILKQMTNQLKDIAGQKLKEIYQKEITHIDFSFSNDEHSYDSLEEVIVYVAETDRQRNDSMIEEVVINTKEPTEEVSLDEEGITRLLSEMWELEEDILNIKWEEEYVDR